MTRPIRIGVVQFPGSNCERETSLALKRAGCEPVDFLWSQDRALLQALDGFVIVGGFSYEDRVRSGLIASKDPVMQVLRDEAEQGKPILGICNGAQILVESGLVPGLVQHEVAIALAQNQRMKDNQLLGVGFYNQWVYLKAGRPHAESNFSTLALATTPIHIPVAHAEGRFLLSEALYRALQNTAAEFYYYCNAAGEIVPEFPINPNGSLYNLAAIGNAAGNVLAMMPHPERSPSGDAIFTAMRHSIENRRAGSVFRPVRLDLPVPQFCFKPYPISADHHDALDYWVELKIQDNEAISLQNTLLELGVQVSLRKWVHWQIILADPSHADALALKLLNSDLLFNRQKERLCEPAQDVDLHGLERKMAMQTYIIRAHEDERAAEKQQQLMGLLSCDFRIMREIAWQVKYVKADEAAVKALLEHTALLGNPLAHAGFKL